MTRGYIFILLATVFFSSMEVALKTVAHDFNPMQLTCTRFLVGGLLLIPFALRGLRQHGARVTAAAWKGFAGLGFVGLVVPHVLRMLLGGAHGPLLYGAFLGGGILLVWADVLARCVLSGGQELPVGVVTALLGGPFFAFLVRRR